MRRVMSFRWIVAHVVVLAVVGTFVALGFWQLGRLEERRARNARVAPRFAVPRTPLEQIYPPGARWTLAAGEFRRVEVTGTYDANEEVVLLSQSYRGISGHHVVTPLRTEGGGVLIVDRGWVPLDLDTPPVDEAPPPSGRVRLQGVLFRSQVRGLFGPKHPPTGALEQIRRIDLPRLQRQIDGPLYPVWLHLERQEPAQEVRYPRVVPPNTRLDEGPHRSYAIQWFLFATAALATYAARIRAELRRR